MALAKDPTHRLTNADDFAETLNEALSQIDSAAPRAIPPPIGNVKCQACGAQNPASQKFCGECGSSLTGAPPASVRAPAAAKADPTLAPPSAASEPPAKIPVEPGTGQRSILI